MYSRLDPLFKPQLRHAETLDTRQGIRREEQTGGRRDSDHDQNEKAEPATWEDESTVSVRALIAFLEQLIADSQPGQAPVSGERLDVRPPAQNQTPAPAARQAAQASRAYERTYRATHDDAPYTAPDSASIPSINLRPEEIRTIHNLLKDLKTLAGRHIAVLPLRKSDSFLQSLVDAVKALL